MNLIQTMLNPLFSSLCLKVIVSLNLVRQKLLFEVFHEAKPPKLVGRLEATVGEIFGSPTNGLIRNLADEKNSDRGKLIIRCEKIEKGKRKTFMAKITAQNLPNFKWWWFFGGTNAFFRVFRKRKSDELLLYESEVVQNSVNPSWK